MYSIKITGDTAEIYLYSAILSSDYNETTKDIIQEISKFNGKKINLHINSEGGDIFEAQGMYTYLTNHSAKVTVYIEGLCASAASIIAMSGDKICMYENSLFMIHNPAGSVFGESGDMRNLANILDKIRDTIAIIYEKRTGMSHDEIIELMNSETWLSAQEAQAFKFIDEILPAMKIKNSSSDFEAGVKAERDRLRALDELSAPGRENLIYIAKYEDFKNANEIALDLLKLETRYNDAVHVSANAKSSHNEMKSITDLINRMRGYENGR